MPMSDAFDDGEIVASGIIQADVLQQYVDTVRALVHEAKIHFTDGGITASVVDPSNVCMYPSVELSERAFESYDAPGEVNIGVNLDALDERLGSADSDDLLRFGVDMEKRMFRIRYRQIEHEMALIDPDAIRQEPDTPDLDLPNYVELSADHLDDAMSNIDLVSDHVRFTNTDDEFVIEGKGDTDRAALSFDDEDCRRLEVSGDVESLFSLSFLVDVVDPIPTDAVVSIRYGDEFPTWWEYDLFDETMHVEMMLAPRIQSD
jgi:proliferating cell nuclear antigen